MTTALICQNTDLSSLEGSYYHAEPSEYHTYFITNVNNKKGWPVIFQFHQNFFKGRKDMANTPSLQQHASLWESRNIRQDKTNNHFFWNSAFRQQAGSKLPSLTCNFKSSPTSSHKQAANLNNNYPFLQNCVCSKANTRAHT